MPDFNQRTSFYDLILPYDVLQSSKIKRQVELIIVVAFRTLTSNNDKPNWTENCQSSIS